MKKHHVLLLPFYNTLLLAALHAEHSASISVTEGYFEVFTLQQWRRVKFGMESTENHTNFSPIGAGVRVWGP